MESDRATQQTRSRYDRLAPFFDRMEAGVEKQRFRSWRALLWNKVRGPRVLELGVGTGKNIPYYRHGWTVTAFDLSLRMLERAKLRAQQGQVAPRLLLADAQFLPFPMASFDTVVATFVFCSVPDSVQGLSEVRRVLRPGGQLLLLEHVLSSKQAIRVGMNVMNPIAVRLTGANINRDTVSNVELAGFKLVQVENLWSDIVKLIEAEP